MGSSLVVGPGDWHVVFAGQLVGLGVGLSHRLRVGLVVAGGGPGVGLDVAVSGPRSRSHAASDAFWCSWMRLDVDLVVRVVVCTPGAAGVGLGVVVDSIAHGLHRDRSRSPLWRPSFVSLTMWMIEIEVIISYEGMIVISIPVAKRVVHPNPGRDVSTDRMVEANSAVKHDILTKILIMIIMMRITIMVLQIA